MLRRAAAVWGVVGVTLFLSMAVWRVAPHIAEVFTVETTWWQWLAFGFSIVFMAYTEGYKGFQQKFAPRVASRVLYLSTHAGWLNGLLAPAFCLGYFGSTRRRQITAITISLMIAAIVHFVKEFNAPWRGIVDAGVIVGLSWGLLAFLVFVRIAFTNPQFSYEPDLSPALARHYQR